MKKEKTYGMNIGASSLLIIIVILCLVCFAGLSAVSALADYRLSEKLSARTTAYYEAVSKANLEMVRMNQELLAAYEESSSEADYRQKIKESFQDSLTFSYSISDTQALVVSLDPLYPAASSDPLYRITCFEVETVSDLSLDDSLPVFTGN